VGWLEVHDAAVLGVVGSMRIGGGNVEEKKAGGGGGWEEPLLVAIVVVDYTKMGQLMKKRYTQWSSRLVVVVVQTHWAD
jgi:hypothetical protein